MSTGFVASRLNGDTQREACFSLGPARIKKSLAVDSLFLFAQCEEKFEALAPSLFVSKEQSESIHSKDKSAVLLPPLLSVSNETGELGK